MRQLKIFIFLFSLLLIASCGGEQKESEAVMDMKKNLTEIYKESMAVHDSVMPMMDKLYSQQRELKNYRDSISSDSLLKSNVAKTIFLLDSAQEGMMKWMRMSEPVPEDLTGYANWEEVEEIQKEQLKDIKKVSTQMKKAEKQGDELLSKIENQLSESKE